MRPSPGKDPVRAGERGVQNSRGRNVQAPKESDVKWENGERN